MARYVRDFGSPDEVFEADLVRSEQITLSGVTVSRDVHQPGWRWTTHLRTVMGTELCEAHHLGLVLSGRLGIRLRDGTEFEVGPMELMDIPPGHDGWTIGSEPVETLAWSGARAWLARLDALTERVLATIVFTDIVDSTLAARGLGDRSWAELLRRFEGTSRDLVGRYRGRLAKMTGDGVLATFDGAGRALRCTASLTASARDMGIAIRAAVHTGEITTDEEDIHGFAVHETARMLDAAGADEIIVSATTAALAPGPEFHYEARGEHEFKGVDGTRRLYVLRPS